MNTPLFSVIVPLEFHRSQWEQCWRGWQAQTLSKLQYEIILVVPPDFPEREKLALLSGSQINLVYSTEEHDVALCVVGAAQARGQFLFFTESHCWPESDVLEKCFDSFTRHPEWAAFSCRSIPVTHNRLSIVEADMYENDIEVAMTSHPWRKILDQCFVTRRDAYDQCGGFNSQLGHFSEWALAANFAGLGFKIGYVPQACIHHYYIGRLAELRTFTRDFIAGEMRYFAKHTHEPGRHLLEAPAEWICQGNWDQQLAQSLLKIVAKNNMSATSVWRLQRTFLSLKTIGRWLMPAVSGKTTALAGAAVKVSLAQLATQLAICFGSQARISAAFKLYIAALIGHQRLASLQRGNGTRTEIELHVDPKLSWDIFSPDNAGFYPIETHHEIEFRWSETAAILTGWMTEGRHCIRIECLTVRCLASAGLQVFVNERLLSAQDVLIGQNTIDLTFDLTTTGYSTLGWTTLPFCAHGDSRSLGLPITRIAQKLYFARRSEKAQMQI